MDPLIGYRLRHFENFSKNILRGRFAQIDQDKHQFIFDRPQRTVADTLHNDTLPNRFFLPA